jgi:hypothetical protein
VNRLVQGRIERAAFFQANGQDIGQFGIEARNPACDMFVLRGGGRGVFPKVVLTLKDQHDHGMRRRRRLDSRVAGKPCKGALDVFHEHGDVAQQRFGRAFGRFG